MIRTLPSNRMFYLLLVTATVLAILLFAVTQYTTADIVHKKKAQFQPNVEGSLNISKTKSDGASKGASPRRALYNCTSEELTNMLNKTLSLPNDAPKLVHSKSCSLIKDMRSCTDKSCPRPLNPNPEIRLKELMSLPQLKLSDNQRDLILSIGDSIPEDDTEKHCRCQVVSFPMEKFPKHVSKLRCYSWKPIIILATMAKARKLLVWQDASVRWTAKLQFLLNRADKYGQQIFRRNSATRLTTNTIKQTFDYMGEHPCAFMPYPEIACSLQINKRDPLVVQTLLEPFARCALEASCMCPVESPREPSHPCAENSTIKIHCRHRFDQSVLGILLAKLYGEDLYKVLEPAFSYYNSDYVEVKRGMTMTYFKNLTTR